MEMSGIPLLIWNQMEQNTSFEWSSNVFHENTFPIPLFNKTSQLFPQNVISKISYKISYSKLPSFILSYLHLIFTSASAIRH